MTECYSPTWAATHRSSWPVIQTAKHTVTKSRGPQFANTVQYLISQKFVEEVTATTQSQFTFLKMSPFEEIPFVSGPGGGGGGGGGAGAPWNPFAIGIGGGAGAGGGIADPIKMIFLVSEYCTNITNIDAN